ncbi:MAG: methyl-accepting chemotaxis protein [Sedimentibacter saalensis]|uniref:methyl-accepting chemotaxis protein n=1 Tax=Sedimentibacter saalensis TaxID=130788 RepID=UPI002B1EFD3F|nr:methyl-accepting chemotaxis protein [Sedimentibacter saalensis]MEA5095135.1 methyl-accepting chemotaxis protein [Sedimentibacter saalensis]
MNSIKRKMFLNITVIILVVVIAIGGVSSYLTYNVTFDTLEETMQEIAASSADVVTMRLEGYKTIAAEVGLLSQLTSEDITQEEKSKIFNERIAMHGLKDINIADKDGFVASSSGTEIVKHMDYYTASMNGEVFVTDAQFDSATFEMYYIVSAPLWKDGVYGSTAEGVVIVKIDGKTLTDIASQVVIGEAGFAFIIDKEGYIIGHPEYSKVLNLENMILNNQTDGSHSELASLEQRMLNGETSFGTYSNNGAKNMLSYSPIEGTEGWAMLIDVPQSEYMKSTNFSVIATVILGLVSILIAAFMGFRMSNKIADPIIACAERLKLLSEGDLHTEVPKTKSKDETAVLLNSLEKTIVELNAIIQDISHHLGAIVNGDLTQFVDKEYLGDFEPIKDSVVQIVKSLNYIFKNINISAEQVASGSEEVAEGSQVLTQGATEQASSIEELAATINEITEQIISNAKSAQQAKIISEETASDVNNGTKYMELMIEAMDEINSSSVQIGKIIKAIEDIAFQTNILALNAAVEAARAGSAGKGFAVVADEVRNLASKSAEAAKNTTQLIENSLNAISKGAKIADETVESFKMIVNKTNETVSIVESIAEASQQQALGATQINSGIEQISSVVQTNSATAEESAAASQELSSQAAVLKGLIEDIKLRSIHKDSHNIEVVEEHDVIDNDNDNDELSSAETEC